MQVESYPENYKLETTEPLPDVYFATKIEQIINKIAEKEGFYEYNISRRNIPADGGSYFGDLYEIDIKGKSVDGDKEVNIFVKKIIESNESVKVLTVKDIYKTELFTYKSLSKMFEELQDEANIPSEERYKMVKVLEGTDKDMLVMENISKKGFKTYDRMDLVPLQFLELCVKNLAKYHGLSFVIKERHPEYFNKNIKSLKHPFIFEEEFKKIVSDMCKVTISNVDEEFKEIVQKLYDNLFDKLSKYLTDETIKTCLCHGDYRPNNIMMKEEDGQVIEVITIDYQLSHYGCPVFDILFLIYFSTDRDFRKAHMSNLKDLYYESLDNFLKHFDLEAETVYPRGEFEKVFKEKMDFGLLITLQMLSLLFSLKENIPDLTKIQNLYFQVDSRFKGRMQGIIEDFIELGFV